MPNDTLSNKGCTSRNEEYEAEVRELTANRHPERGCEVSIGIYVYEGSPMTGLRPDDIHKNFPKLEIEILTGSPKKGFKVGDEFFVTDWGGDEVGAFMRQYFPARDHSHT